VKQFGFLSILLLAASISPLFAQHKVDMRNLHERLYLVVPMIGDGTPANPRRPMYAPLPGEQSGIIAFTFRESDNGRFALVQLVARDRAAFKHIFDDHHPLVKIFEKGKDKKADIEAEFHKYKANFDLDQLTVNVP
jgi:hypothetical protein